MLYTAISSRSELWPNDEPSYVELVVYWLIKFNCFVVFRLRFTVISRISYHPTREPLIVTQSRVRVFQFEKRSRSLITQELDWRAENCEWCSGFLVHVWMTRFQGGFLFLYKPKPTSVCCHSDFGLRVLFRLGLVRKKRHERTHEMYRPRSSVRNKCRVIMGKM